MSASFPYPSFHHLARRVSQAPRGATVHRWVLRDDNHQHHHGILSQRDGPVYVELYWKADARDRAQRVGLFELDLHALLAEGYVRSEEDTHSGHVWLRFHRGERGVVEIQARADGPSLPVGTVDLTGSA